VTTGEAFWEESEQVERFAARQPDLRLKALAENWSRPAEIRALDLGCAAGRNAVYLAELGCGVWAVDLSGAMVTRTRARLAEILGSEEAERRVRVGPMDDLAWAPAGSFDLVVALGILHCAQSGAEWSRAVSEVARVLRPGGQLLVSAFTPETDLAGTGIRPAGAAHVYEGFPGGRRSYLVDAAGLDAGLARHGFEPVATTETTRRSEGAGRRVSANGLYVRRPSLPGTG
jgi:SAM-dependent methyltransferase